MFPVISQDAAIRPDIKMAICAFLQTPNLIRGGSSLGGIEGKILDILSSYTREGAPAESSRQPNRSLRIFKDGSDAVCNCWHFLRAGFAFPDAVQLYSR